MTNLPRRRIEPLDPAPGSFDRVLTTARRRRRRTALVVASSTLAVALVALGSFTLGSSLNATHRVEPAARGQGDGNGTASPSAQASPTGSGLRSPGKHTHAGGQAQPGTTGTISRLRGRAVDPNGHGIPGLYVLPGRPNQLTFSSDGTVGAHTNADGYYDIPCPRAPVLLATWQLNNNLQAVLTGGTWASTFVEGSTTKPVVPSCGRRHTTTMGLGASLHGTVHVQGNCAPGTTFPLWVWLNGDRTETVRLVGLRDGETFTFAGLPAGTHTLGARGVTTSITFVAGDNQEQDALFTCADGATPGGPDDPSSPPGQGDQPSSPSATPSPTPTPTPTPSASTS